MTARGVLRSIAHMGRLELGVMQGPSPNIPSQAARIGPFEIERALGAGGMAETFVAIRRGPEGFEQRVCLKRVLPALGKDPEFTRQFTSEAKIAAALRHGNIVQVLDFGEHEGTFFQALELIEGLDLRALLERVGRAGLSPGLVAYVGAELAQALDYAHRAAVLGQAGGVVHRDVSPSNVLLSLEGEVKLADFGIARTVQGPKHTATGVIRGKVPYMAPEYARTGKFDKRADLFSLGVLLFESLSGQRPYDGLTELETLHRAMVGEHPSLAALAPEAPLELVALVEALIHPSPEQRPETASAVVDGLLRAVPLQNARRRLSDLVRHAVAARETDAALRAGGGEEGASDLPAAAKNAADDGVAMADTRTAVPRGTWGAERRSASEPPRSTASALAGWGLLLVVALLGCAWGVTRLLTAETRVPLPPAVAGPGAAQSDPQAAPIRIDAPPSEKIDGFPGLAAPAKRSVEPRPADEPALAASGSTAQARAVLTVIVMPFGEVHIDGRPYGPAPVSVSLKPGPHEVRVSGAALTASRSIQLAPGEKRRLEVH